MRQQLVGLALCSTVILVYREARQLVTVIDWPAQAQQLVLPTTANRMPSPDLSPSIVSLPPPSPSALPPPEPSSLAAGNAPLPRTHQTSILVGLNRPVFKNVKQRAYTCPALRGGCVFTTERSRFGEAHALIDVLKDARKAGQLDFKVRRGQLKGVVISEKDEAKKQSAAFRQNKYDFEVRGRLIKLVTGIVAAE